MADHGIKYNNCLMSKSLMMPIMQRLMDCLKDFEDKGKQEIWDCLLQNNRTDASWDNYLDYHSLSRILLSRI